MKSPKNIRSQKRIIPQSGRSVTSRHPRLAQLSWFRVGGSGHVGQNSFVSR